MQVNQNVSPIQLYTQDQYKDSAQKDNTAKENASVLLPANAKQQRIW
ncbi:hypothetical protein [Paraburkholderia adhaesiva]|nr:hypothetical protein [Paraburkholderia adhaesiva]